MLATILLITALGGRSGPTTPIAGTYPDRPRVEVWTNRGDDPFHTGEDARVYLRADRDAYIALFRVDTDGRVRVLFPRDPWGDNFVRAGREFVVEGGRRDDAFEIDDYPGVGYIFAISSADPFDFDPITSGDHWDYRVIADGRVRGDPYVALTDLAERIVPSGDTDWDYDIAPYYVERHYDYPRFLCYDCHSYASFSYWNPYAYSCVRFRIVVFDDPYYYPYRYYGGRRVVFTRPLRPQPRFIFKDRNGVGDDRFVTRERERPVNNNGRRGVRGADLGGRGSVPVPDVNQRQRRDRSEGNGARPERPRSADPRDRNDQRGSRREEPARREVPLRREGQARREDPARREEPASRRPDAENQGRPEARPRVDERRRPPVERPDPPARQEGQPRDRGRDERGTYRDPQQRRPQADPRDQPSPRREEPRAEPRRGRDAAPAGGKSREKPELRRRRP